MLCASEVYTAATRAATTTLRYWVVGSRTQFNVDSQTYIGLDVIYTALDQNMALPAGAVYNSSQGQQPFASRTADRPERVDGGVPLPS